MKVSFGLVLSGGCCALSNAIWSTYDNINAVKNYGKGLFPVEVHKNINSADECKSIAEESRTTKNVTIWTWHDENQGQYKYQCVLRLDGEWVPKGQSGHISGHYEPQPAPTPPPAPPQDWECSWRSLAFDYARTLQPERGSELLSVFDALQLSNLCGLTRPELPQPNVPSFPVPRQGEVLFVNFGHGSDDSSGSEERPLKTLQAAVDKALEIPSPTTIVLRAGHHYVESTVQLKPEHAGLQVMNYPGEEAWLVGGRVLTGIQWRQHDTSTGNIWVADVSGDVKALRVRGERSIPARFPNANPERDMFPVGWINSNKEQWWGGNYNHPGTTFKATEPNRSEMTDLFLTYSVGQGGECDNFSPPVSYWCADTVSGGGAHHYTYPRGMAFNRSTDLQKEWFNWTKDSSSELHVWRPSHWAGWMFEIADYNWDNASISFGRGGFQGARGSDHGQQWFVSHVFDELDAPGEYFYDKTKQQLFLYHNGTGAPPVDEVVAVTTQVLIAANASQTAPVRNVSILGVGLRDTAPTYLEPHGVPSAGDWALERTGALFFEGTEDIRIEQCSFLRLDGNAIMLSAYNRDVSIVNSRFNWLGGSAMAAWGFTDELSADAQYGFDGTDGNFPLGTTVMGNIAHELGMWEKQSSMWFQAKAARSTIKRNLFFNGPRAGINFNDGFGGGDEVAENLIFNTCRESGDHGPINSWDRQPYLTTVRTGEASIVPEYRNIHHNFIVANYNGFKGVDNDDGSSWYKISFNFMVGGWMHKSNYGGIMKHTFGNLGAYVTMGMRMQAPQFPGWVDSFYNNTLVMKAKGAVTYAEVGVVKDKCPEADCWQIMGNNSVFTDAVSPEVHTENKGADYGFDNWLALGHDTGTTLTKSLPMPSTIVSWARVLLSIGDGSSGSSSSVLLV